MRTSKEGIVIGGNSHAQSYVSVLTQKTKLYKRSVFTFASILNPHTAQVVTAIAVITIFVVVVVFFAHVHVLDMDLCHII